jgi:hypothetical protein
MADTAAPVPMSTEAGVPDAQRAMMAERMMGQMMHNGAQHAIPAGAGVVEEPEGNGEEMDEDSDFDDGGPNKKFQDYKCKPRRKATQKPVVGIRNPMLYTHFVMWRILPVGVWLSPASSACITGRGSETPGVLEAEAWDCAEGVSVVQAD